MSAKHGIIATTIKGAFKIYVAPTARARSALATLTESWSDLVAEARQEYEARRGAEIQPESGRSAGTAAPEAPAPATEPKRQQVARPKRRTTAGGASRPRAAGTREEGVAGRPRDEAALPPSTSGPADPEGLEAPSSPTLVKTGDSGVELRPNPAISPAHATSGVIAHVPPEVRHKLAGDGPIRA